MSSPRLLRHAAERLGLLVVGGLLAVFLALPLVGLVVTSSLAGLGAGLADPLVWPALWLSLWTTALSLALTLALGTPLAWALARSSSGLQRAVETLVELPLVIPPAVAGIAMLLAFGRRGLLSGWLYPEGFSLAFTTAAVVLAQLFVGAPFYVRAAIGAFRRIDEDLIVVARSLGASPLRVLIRVALPLAAPGLAAGAVMSWARSLGEFGATLMFAGNLRRSTQTLPLAIYAALEGDLGTAQAMSILLVVVALLVLLASRALLARSHHEGRSLR